MDFQTGFITNRDLYVLEGESNPTAAIWVDLLTAVNSNQRQVYPLDTNSMTLGARFDPAVGGPSNVVCRDIHTKNMWVLQYRGRNLYNCSIAGAVLNTYDLTAQIGTTVELLCMCYDSWDRNLWLIGIDVPAGFGDPIIRVYYFRNGIADLRFSYTETRLDGIPVDITVDDSHNLWIVEREEKKIKQFTIEGELLQTIDLSLESDLVCLTGIAFNGTTGTLWVGKRKPSATINSAFFMEYTREAPVTRERAVWDYSTNTRVDIQDAGDIVGIPGINNRSLAVDSLDNSLYIGVNVSSFPSVLKYHGLNGKVGSLRDMTFEGLSSYRPTYGSGNDIISGLTFDPATGELWGIISRWDVRETNHWLAKYNKQTGAIMELYPDVAAGGDFTLGIGAQKSLAGYGVCSYRYLNNLYFLVYYTAFDALFAGDDTKRLDANGNVLGTNAGYITWPVASLRPACGMVYNPDVNKMISAHAWGLGLVSWVQVRFVHRDIHTLANETHLFDHTRLTDYYPSRRELGIFRKFEIVFEEYSLSGVSLENTKTFAENEAGFGYSWDASSFDFNNQPALDIKRYNDGWFVEDRAPLNVETSAWFQGKLYIGALNKLKYSESSDLVDSHEFIDDIVGLISNDSYLYIIISTGTESTIWRYDGTEFTQVIDLNYVVNKGTVLDNYLYLLKDDSTNPIIKIDINNQLFDIITDKVSGTPRCITEFEESIYIGTDTGTLYVYKPDKDIWQELMPLSTDVIDIVKSKRRLFTAAGRILYLIKGYEREEIRTFNTAITNLLTNKDELLCVVTAD